MDSRFFAVIARSAFWLFLAVPLISEVSQAQQSYPNYGVRGATFNPGRSKLGNTQFVPTNVGFGNYVTNGNICYGSNGLYPAFGGLSYSTGSFSTIGNGQFVYGVGRIPQNAFYYPGTIAVPSIVPNAAFGTAPWIWGYGTGVFSPNWPGWSSSGSIGYLAPGYSIDPYTGIAVPYNPWCLSTLPYFGGVNPYYSGSILGPTIISLNLSMRPSVPSMASYTLTDPRLLDVLAPAPQPLEALPVPVIPNPANPGPVLDAPPLPDPTGGVPLLNEFEAVPRSDKHSTLAEKINSLRYQSTGDDAFRKEDYASAEVFYQSAIDMAPDRRSPYLRMAFAQIALADFPKAVSYLKAGLQMPADATRSWISAEELYSFKVAERARTQGVKLWNWLAEQPLSSDRLLLAGTFQKLRGIDAAADELLNLASHEGPEAASVAAVNEIARSDIGQRAAAHELAQIFHEASKKAPLAIDRQPAASTVPAATPAETPAEVAPLVIPKL